jgi:hypothetical protein
VSGDALDFQSWPTLEPAALYGIAGELVETIRPHTEADDAGLLVATLVDFGAMVGPAPHAAAGSADHPARLNACLVGRSSKGRKGTAVTTVGRVMRQVDQRYSTERRLNGFGSGESIVDALRGVEDNYDPRLLINEPEFARILSVASRDGSTLSAIVRQGWDGGRLAVRSRSGTTVAENSHLCVLAQCTVEELRAKLTSTEVANGFANRFLFVCVRKARSLPSGGHLDDADLAPFVRKFALFADAASKLGRIVRTPDAEELWADLYRQMDEDEPPGLLGAIIARDQPQTLRLSVAYCLLDGAKRIDVAHVQAAASLWQYCRDSAAYVFGESIGNPTADRLLQGIRAAGSEGLDGRQRSALFAGHKTHAELEQALQLLESKDLVEVEEITTGGRPAVIARAKKCELREQRALQGQREQSSAIDRRSMHGEQSEQSEQSEPDNAFWSSAEADALLDRWAACEAVES